MDILPVTKDRFGDLANLFETGRETGGCWCMFFLLTGRELHEGWGVGNRARFEELVATQELPAGLLAYRDGQPVGWCAVGPRSRYPRALRSPILKQRDPAEDPDVWLVPCFFVRREARRTGITRALLTAAVTHSSRHGATAVEGFPLAGGDRRLNTEAYLGVEPVFTSCGFTPVARPSARRVVMRRDLPAGRRPRR